MRYLIQECFESELTARKEYIARCLQLWCMPPKRVANFYEFKSIPSNELDILFIVGHNMNVNNFLHSQKITEKTIVAITCDGTVDFSWLKNLSKNVFFSNQNKQGYSELLKGSLYNFEFDLTESEVMFYNTRKNKNVLERLNQCFTRM